MRPVTASRARPWIRRLIACGAFALAVVYAATSGAMAPIHPKENLGSSNRLHYKTEATASAIPAGESARAFVLCREDNDVVGGGAALDGAAQEGWITETLNLAAEGKRGPAPDGGWVGDAKNLAGLAKTFRGYAICSRDQVRGLRYREQGRVIPPGRAKLTAKCPAGTEVLGGGGWVQRAGTSFIRESFPVDLGDADKRPDDGWRVGVYNGTAMNLGAMVTAICLKVDRWRLSYRRQVADAVQADNVAHPVVSCPEGSSAAAGGASVERAPGEAWLNATRPVDDGSDADAVPDDGWEAYLYNASGDAKKTTAYAICKR